MIFDCFGVIIADSLQILTDELRKNNPLAAVQVKNIVRSMNSGVGDLGAARQQIADVFGMDLQEFRNKVNQGEVRDRALMEYISKLHKNYKTAMLSNVPSDGLTSRFTKQELESLFDIVVASGDIGYAKPEPEAYQFVAEKLNVRFDECVFIDDRTVYCEGAKAVGMQAILYEDFAQMKAELEKILETG